MNANKFIHDQRGASVFKVLLVLIALILMINAGFRYFGVVYNCESIKSEMRAAVYLGQASGANVTVATEQARQRIQRSMQDNGAPSNAYLEVWSENGQMNARVAFSLLIPLLPFNLYDQLYVFDETVTPTGFLPKVSPGK